MSRMERQPRLRVTIEFCDDEEKTLDAFMEAIKTVVEKAETSPFSL